MTTLDGMAAREITDGIYWLGGCMEILGPSRPTPIHYHVSTYLVLGSEKTVLVDTGDPRHWPRISVELRGLLDDRKLDYVFPTHPELPHAGNLLSLLEMYPEAVIVGDIRDYGVHFPEISDRLQPMAAGDVLDLGDHQLCAVPAYIRDLPNTLWAYEPKAQALFVSDGFSYIHDAIDDPPFEIDEPAHSPGQCRLLSNEMSVPPTVEQAAYGTGRALYWTRFVDVTATFSDIEQFLSEHPTQFVAPAHGNVINDVDSMLRVSLAAHRQVYETQLTQPD